MLARKGSLRRAEDGAPLRAPLRSGLKEDDDGRLRRDDTPIPGICVTRISFAELDAHNWFSVRFQLFMPGFRNHDTRAGALPNVKFAGLQFRWEIYAS